MRSTSKVVARAHDPAAPIELDAAARILRGY
jgi:hypothetical protein